MNGLEFIASVVASLAWPATVVAAFFVLRSHLPGLFPFIERLKYKNFEVEFRRSVQELTAKSQATLPGPDDYQLGAPKERLYGLAEISPRSAILEAWLQVESAAADALQERDPSLGSQLRMWAPLRLGERLKKHGVLGDVQLEIYSRLRELRNRAVHIGDATFHALEVKEYIDLALSLASQIRRALPNGA